MEIKVLVPTPRIGNTKLIKKLLLSALNAFNSAVFIQCIQFCCLLSHPHPPNGHVAIMHLKAPPNLCQGPQISGKLLPKLQREVNPDGRTTTDTMIQNF
jgi:hypothetical protein